MARDGHGNFRGGGPSTEASQRTPNRHSFLAGTDSPGQFLRASGPHACARPRAASLVRLDHGPATAPRVRCGGSRWEKRMRLPVDAAPTAVLAGSGPPMAASEVGYANTEVVDARTLRTSGVAAVDCWSQCGLFPSWVCVGRCPTEWVHVPIQLTLVVFTPRNWHHWERASWTV